MAVAKITTVMSQVIAWLQPMLLDNDGRCMTVEAVFFPSNTADAAQVLQKFKSAAPACFVGYPEEQYMDVRQKSVERTGNNVAGCAEVTALSFPVAIVFTDRDDQPGKAEFIYTARDRIFNAISSRSFFGVNVEDADGNEAKVATLDFLNAQAIDTEEMIAWFARFRIQMYERSVRPT